MNCCFEKLLPHQDNGLIDFLDANYSPTSSWNQSQYNFEILMFEDSKTEKYTLLPETGSIKELPVEVQESVSPSTVSELHQEHRRTKRAVNLRLFADFIVEQEAITKNRKQQRRPQPIKVEPKYSKEQYPTKNLLQNFKGAHLNYLQMHFPAKQLRKMQILKPLYARNTMNMKAYEKLYGMHEFQEVFEKMFEEKYLYRSMMLSRSESTAKKNHVGKIEVFEEAFKNKQFKSIN